MPGGGKDVDLNERILVVDDDPLFLREISGLLEQLGAQCSTAADSFEALARAREHPPAAILLDVVLPDIPGPQLCRLLRQLPELASVPIIFITGREDEQALTECLEAGGDDFIRKSHLRLELPLRLRGHLQRRQERRRLEQRNQENQALLYLTRLLNRSLSLPGVLQSMVEEVGQTLQADRCSVILWNDRSGRILATAETTTGDIELDLARYPEISEALETRETVFIPDVRADQDTGGRSRFEALDRQGVQSLLVVPLQTGEGLLGTLFVRTRRPQRIAEEAVAFCQAAAEIASRAILNAHLFEHVRAERDDLRRRPGGVHKQRGRELRLWDLHLGMMRETLGATAQLRGLSDLLLDSGDMERLSSRHVRNLRKIQERVRILERTLRLLPLAAAEEPEGPAQAGEVARAVLAELRPEARAQDLALELVVEQDWRVPESAHLRNLLRTWLRRLIDGMPGNLKLRLLVERERVVLAAPGALSGAAGAASEDFGLWQQAALARGFDMHETPTEQGCEIRFEFRPPAAGEALRGQ